VVNQWTPNLINFNPSVVSRSVSYYGQQGFSLYRTANNLNAVTASTQPESSNVYHNIGQDASGNYVIRLVNYNAAAKTVRVAASGVKFTASGSTKWQLNSAGSTNLQAANTVDNLNVITPKTGALASSEVDSTGALALTLPAYSFSVITVKSASVYQFRKAARSLWPAAKE
jgi:alpha-L-arabinofuranosidase